MTLSSPARGFDADEYADRTAKAQDAMARLGLDGMLLSTEAEVRYFTGFHTLFWQSPTRPWFVFVPATGKPVAVIPEIGAALMRQTWLDDIRTWPAPRPADDGMSLLRDLLQPLADQGARLGVPMAAETTLRMPLADWQELREALPGLQISDATPVIQALRRIKSAAELEKLAHIGAIGSRAFAALPQRVSEGQPLDDVFRQFRMTALSAGADDVPYLVGGASQGGYADVISPPTSAPLRAGDVLMLDTGCTWDGYFCDFDRNWAIKRADDTARRAYDVLWRATETGLHAARPGATCRDLFHAMSAVLSKMDSTGGDIGRLGHGLGMQLTEHPSLAAFDETPLAPNMVLTLEPSLSYGDGLMMVHEENIVITEAEPRLLSTRATPELPVIG